MYDISTNIILIAARSAAAAVSRGATCRPGRPGYVYLYMYVYIYIYIYICCYLCIYVCMFIYVFL